VKLTEMPIQE